MPKHHTKQSLIWSEHDGGGPFVSSMAKLRMMKGHTSHKPVSGQHPLIHCDLPIPEEDIFAMGANSRRKSPSTAITCVS